MFDESCKVPVDFLSWCKCLLGEAKNMCSCQIIADTRQLNFTLKYAGITFVSLETHSTNNIMEDFGYLQFTEMLYC